MTGKGFLIVMIATLVTIIAWVSFDVYDKREKAQIPSNIQELVEPIDPNFDLSGVE